MIVHYHLIFLLPIKLNEKVGLVPNQNLALISLLLVIIHKF